MLWAFYCLYDMYWGYDIVGLVHSTDRDQLTALGQNLTSLHQIRVPRLEPGIDWSGSTQAAEVLQSRPAV